MKELVDFMAKSLADEPDQVEVQEHSRGRDAVLELHVAPGDVGRIIGRHGRNVRSMRISLAGAAEKAHKHVTLDVAE